VIKASLERLQMEYVDILYCHRFDYDIEVEHVCESMNWVINQGYAHYWGTSSWPSDMVTAALEICRCKGWVMPVVEQPEYSLAVRENVEESYRRLFERYGYGSTVFSPLAGGLLTGKYNDGIPADSRYGQLSEKLPFFFYQYFGKDKKAKNLDGLKNLKSLAESMGFTMAQLSLAWIIANRDVSSCILGFSGVG
jgi:aryl-alcohol dehydrogenase-like predicted oxidoreductase